MKIDKNVIRKKVIDDVIQTVNIRRTCTSYDLEYHVDHQQPSQTEIDIIKMEAFESIINVLKGMSDENI